MWKGTLLLAKVEQGVTLQPVIGRHPNLWRNVTEFRPAGQLISPIPGDDSTFQQFRMEDPDVPDHASFGDGDIGGDPNLGTARYLWTERRMVPAWKDKDNAWRKINGQIDVSKLLSGGYKQLP